MSGVQHPIKGDNMCGLLPGLQKAITVKIEIPMPETEQAAAPKAKRIKLKKKSGKSKESSDTVDGVELGDTMMRKMLPDMNSQLEK